MFVGDLQRCFKMDKSSPLKWSAYETGLIYPIVFVLILISVVLTITQTISIVYLIRTIIIVIFGFIMYFFIWRRVFKRD